MTMENDLVERLTAERDEAFEAENEAKDCFWAIYPEYLSLGGTPVSTEAARTLLASRIQALEAELARKTEALERQYPIIQSLGHLLDEYGRTQRDLSKLIGLRARASELVRGRRTLSKDMMELINNEWKIPIEELFATTRFVECLARSALEEKTDV